MTAAIQRGGWEIWLGRIKRNDRKDKLESKVKNGRKMRPQRLRKLVDAENDLRVLKVKI
jgi:hypothetical protein